MKHKCKYLHVPGISTNIEKTLKLYVPIHILVVCIDMYDFIHICSFVVDHPFLSA